MNKQENNSSIILNEFEKHLSSKEIQLQNELDLLHKKREIYALHQNMKTQLLHEIDERLSEKETELVEKVKLTLKEEIKNLVSSVSEEIKLYKNALKEELQEDAADLHEDFRSDFFDEIQKDMKHMKHDILEELEQKFVFEESGTESDSSSDN